MNRQIHMKTLVLFFTMTAEIGCSQKLETPKQISEKPIASRLQGLKSIRLSVSVDNDREYLKRQIMTDTELTLRTAGLIVSDSTNKEESYDELRVSLSIFQHDDKFKKYDAHVVLGGCARLLRNNKLNADAVTVPLWIREESQDAMTNTRNTEEFRNAFLEITEEELVGKVRNLVSEFVNDYLKANPKQ